MPKLNKSDIPDILDAVATGAEVADLAEMYCCSAELIGKVCRGEIHKSADIPEELISAARAALASKNPNKGNKVGREKALEACRRVSEGESSKKIAADLQMTSTMINLIVAGRSYKDAVPAELRERAQVVVAARRKSIKRELRSLPPPVLVSTRPRDENQSNIIFI